MGSNVIEQLGADSNATLFQVKCVSSLFHPGRFCVDPYRTISGISTLGLAACRGLKPPGTLADTYAMSMIDGIASMSTALSQLKLQTEVSTRVLKMAQGQDQLTAQLVDAAMENVQEILTGMAEGLGNGVDVYG
jgi:hypothetical protein